MISHTKSKEKKIVVNKKHIFIIVLFLVISIAVNVYLLVCLNDSNKVSTVESFDNKYSARLLNAEKYYSVQIIANAGNVTDKSAQGMIDYTSRFMYAGCSRVELFWSKKGYDLFVLSSDIGIICLHYDESSGLWNECYCDFNYSGGIDLYDLESTDEKYVIQKGYVPKEVLNFYSKDRFED